MKLAWRPRALADLAEIRDYQLEHSGEPAAERVRRHFSRRLETPRHRPMPGIASDNPNIRIISPTKYPYRIYFTVIDRSIVILHIRHTARPLPKLDELS